jgi:hypothetical protein
MPKPSDPFTKVSPVQQIKMAQAILRDIRSILHCPEGASIIDHSKDIAKRLKLGAPSRPLIG